MVSPASFVVVLALSALQQEEAPEATTRVHDLSRLLALRGAWSARFDLSPLPMAVGLPERPWQEIKDEVTFDADSIVELLRALCVDEGAGDAVELTPRGETLVVKAPTAVNERIARALAGIESACLGGERLEVRVIAGEPLPDAPMLLDLADADRRVRALVESGRGSVRRVGSTSLQDGVFSTIDELRSERYVGDYEVEIAHGSVIYDPITVGMSLGLSASVRAARARGATWLDLAIRWSEPAAPMVEQVVNPRVWYASPSPHRHEGEELPDDSELVAAMFHGEIPLRIESPRNRSFGFAGSFALPDGKALWIPCRAASRAVPVTPGDATSLALELRVVGPVRRSELRLADVESDGDGVTILHVGALASDGFEVQPGRDTMLQIGVVDVEDPAEFWPSLVTAAPLRDHLLDGVKRVFPDLADQEEEGRQLLRRFTPNHVLLRAPAAVRATVIAQLERERAPSPPVELTARVTRGSETVATFRIPATPGLISSLWSGVEGSYLSDWDVDVADQALVGNPAMSWFLDGVALRFMVLPLRDGRLQLTVDGQLNLLDAAPRRKTLPDPYTPCYDKLQVARLRIDETRNVALEGGKASVRFGGDPLALEVAIALAPGADAPRLRPLDRRALLQPHGPWGAALDLCPWPFPNHPLDSMEAASEPRIDEDDLRAVVEAAIGSEGDDADSEADARIDRLAELFEAACLGDESLEVRVLAGDGLLDGPLVVDAAESDRRVAALVAAGKARVVRSGSTAIMDGVAATIEQLGAELCLPDYEVEIAHGAAVYDPIASVEETGMRASVRAARAAGATRLDVAIREVEPDAPRREQVVRPTIWLSSPLPPAAGGTGVQSADGSIASVVNVEVPLLFEPSRSRVLGVATSYLLPDGKALWIPCRAKSALHPTAPEEFALEVRVRGPARATGWVLEKRPTDESEDAILNLGEWRSVGFEAPTIDVTSMSSDDFDSGFDESWWPSTVAQKTDGIDVLEIARRAFLNLSPADDAFVAPLSPNHLFVHAPEALRRQLGQKLAEACPSGRAIELHGRVLDGAATIGEFRLPATTGRLATIWSGVTGTFLSDWDVDVAGESMIGNPEIGSFLDGVALRFVVRSSSDAELQLEATGVVNVLDGPPAEKAIDNPYTPTYEKLESRRLFFAETRNLPCADRVAVARFGGDALALEVTVTLR